MNSPSINTSEATSTNQLDTNALKHPTEATADPSNTTPPEEKKEVYFVKACSDNFIQSVKDIRCYNMEMGAAYYRVTSGTEANPWGHQGPRFSVNISANQQFGKKSRAFWGLGVFGGGSWFSQNIGDPSNEIQSSARSLFGGLKLHLGVDIDLAQKNYNKLVSFATAIGVGPTHLKSRKDGFRFSSIGGGNPIPDVSSMGAIVSPQVQIAFARGAITLFGAYDIYTGLSYQAPSQVPGVMSPEVSIPVQGLAMGANLDVNSIILQIRAAVRGDKTYFLDRKEKEGTVPTPTPRPPVIPPPPLESEKANEFLKKLRDANITLFHEVKKLANIKEELNIALAAEEKFENYVKLAKSKEKGITQAKLKIQKALIDALHALEEVENLNLTARQNTIYNTERSKLESFITNKKNENTDSEFHPFNDLDFIIDDMQYLQYDPIVRTNKINSIKTNYSGLNKPEINQFSEYSSNIEGYLKISNYYLDMLEEVKKQFPENDPNQVLVQKLKENLINAIESHLNKGALSYYNNASQSYKKIEKDNKLDKKLIDSFRKELEAYKDQIDQAVTRFNYLK